MASTKSWYILAISLSTFIWIKAQFEAEPDVLQNVVKLQGANVTVTLRARDYYEGEGQWRRCVPGNCRHYSYDNCTAIEYIGKPIRYHVSTQSVLEARDYELTIVGVLLEDAGRYTFYENSYGGRYSAEVIILESDPQCSRNTSNGDVAFEGDVIVMSCQVRYQGRWAPWMVWQEDGANMDATLNETVGGSGRTPGLAKYTLIVAARPSQSGAVYSMVARFRQTGIINDYQWDDNSSAYYYGDSYHNVDYHADNTPSYMFSHQFRPLKVIPSDKQAKDKAGEKHNDSTVILAAVIPNGLLVICSIALGVSLWKGFKYYRRAKQSSTQLRSISTTSETARNECEIRGYADNDTTEFPYRKF